MTKNIFLNRASLTAATLAVVVLSLIAAPMVSGESAGVTEPEDSEKSTSRSERLKARRAEFKVILDENAKKRLAIKCVVAQKTVSLVKKRDGTIREKRHTAYTKLMDRLNEVTLGLQKQGLGTAALQETQARLTDAVNKYLADAEVYRATINDLTQMSCAGAVEDWQTTLLAARTQRQQLKVDAAEIKETLGNVREALQAAKKALAESQRN